MITYILNLVYLVFVFGFSFFNQKIQVTLTLSKISKSLKKLQGMRDKAKDDALAAIMELGKPKSDPKPRLESLLHFFSIKPNRMDPAGAVKRLEVLVDTADARVKEEVQMLAPSADEEQVQNLHNLVEVAQALNSLYRTVRHHYLSGKKSGSIYSTLQIQMELPFIMEEAKAYSSFVDAFKRGEPIGDGVGPLVASKLMGDAVRRDVAEDMVATEVEFEGRRLVVTKAKGPGGVVGKPGDAVRRLVEEFGDVSLIVMVDAGLKLEGESSGFVVEGVGPAIGGVGVDQYKIEEVATKHKIPIHCLIARQSMLEVLAPMTKVLYGSVDSAVEKLRRALKERTKEGDRVLVVGVGNTIGVA
jgi:hypothetical protein